jgi:hypothetical protein
LSDESCNNNLIASNPKNTIPAPATHKTAELTAECDCAGATSGTWWVVPPAVTVAAGAGCLRWPKGYCRHSDRGAFLPLGGALADAPASPRLVVVARANETATTRITDAAVME